MIINHVFSGSASLSVNVKVVLDISLAFKELLMNALEEIKKISDIVDVNIAESKAHDEDLHKQIADLQAQVANGATPEVTEALNALLAKLAPASVPEPSPVADSTVVS